MTVLDPSQPFNVLFLCTGNSARSILAESIMNKVGRGRFVAYSAGSHPKGEVHPCALKLLERLGHPTAHLQSKPWDEFARPGAPDLHFVITVCDNAAGEVCPVWPGQPISSHWGLPDPAAVTGSDAQVTLAFADTFRMLNNRIGIFTSLPVEKLDQIALKQRMDDIGGLKELTRAPTDAQVEAISPEDPKTQPLFDQFLTWLTAADLPVKDLADEEPRYFVLRSEAGQPIGFGGLSGYGSDLLLRSLVVDPEQRDHGAGARLVSALESIARDSGAERLWLLTSNAGDWFEANGWRKTARSEAPATIAESGQFRSVCPPDAMLLTRDLRG